MVRMIGYMLTYGAFGTDPPTPFGVGGLNSIEIALPAFAGTSSTAGLAMTIRISYCVTRRSPVVADYVGVLINRSFDCAALRSG